MSEKSAFLQAIIADPADDTPRLVYADWLQEHGEGERAEFIRVQCELARLDDCGETTPSGIAGGIRAGCRVCVLKRRERELLETPTPDVKGYTAILNARRLPWGHAKPEHVRRGFVEEVRCSAADWLAHADALHWHPSQDRPCPETAQPIRKVVLTTASGLLFRNIATFGGPVWVCDQFPGVEFDLPPLPGTGGSVTVGGVAVPVWSWSMSPPG